MVSCTSSRANQCLRWSRIKPPRISHETTCLIAILANSIEPLLLTIAFYLDRFSQWIFSTLLLKLRRGSTSLRYVAHCPLRYGLESNHKLLLQTLVPGPRSFFMDVKCPGCFTITTVFSHAQTVVICAGCSTVLCQPTGGKARLTEGCSFRRK